MGIEFKEYHLRREQVMTKIGNGTAIFRSAPMATMHNDVEYTYRQDSSFYYLTGFNEPEAVAVFAPHHQEHRYILFVQPKDPEKLGLDIGAVSKPPKKSMAQMKLIPLMS